LLVNLLVCLVFLNNLAFLGAGAALSGLVQELVAAAAAAAATAVHSCQLQALSCVPVAGQPVWLPFLTACALVRF
jgi:hypothetical protein